MRTANAEAVEKNEGAIRQVADRHGVWSLDRLVISAGAGSPPSCPRTQTVGEPESRADSRERPALQERGERRPSIARELDVTSRERPALQEFARSSLDRAAMGPERGAMRVGAGGRPETRGVATVRAGRQGAPCGLPSGLSGTAEPSPGPGIGSSAAHQPLLVAEPGRREVPGAKSRVSALFVARDSVYRQLPDVVCYDESQDARLYNGPWPVVAHPPCERWGGFARANGWHIGEDGGCFTAAVLAVRKWGASWSIRLARALGERRAGRTRRVRAAGSGRTRTDGRVTSSRATTATGRARRLGSMPHCQRERCRACYGGRASRPSGRGLGETRSASAESERCSGCAGRSGLPRQDCSPRRW